MATPHAVTPLAGVDLNSITTAALVGPRFGAEDAPQLGVQVQGTNGRRYVYAQANASIPANTAVCNIDATTFLVAASGGSYRSPAVAMASGDRGWFSAASV